MISSTVANNVNSDFATGLSTCIAKDGQSVPTANIPLGGFKLTGLAAGTTAGDSIRYEQLQNITQNWVVAGGTADAITATYSPAVTALVDGQLLSFRASAANATTTPTFSPNGLTARTITLEGGSALRASEIPAALAEVILRYNLANTRWELLNPAFARGATLQFSSNNATQADGLTRYFADGLSATETDIIFRIPYAGTLTNLYAQTPAMGSGTRSYTVRVNGVDTALTCTQNAPSTTANDTTHSVAVAQGDYVAIKVLTYAGASTITQNATLALR